MGVRRPYSKDWRKDHDLRYTCVPTSDELPRVVDMECQLFSPRSFLVPCSFSVLALFLCLASGPSAEADDLQELARSVHWTSRHLQETPADDLRIDLPHKSSLLRHTELVYGTPDSRRVAIAVGDTSDGPVFYVDSDRNRVMDESDRVPGSGDLRALSLNAEHVVEFVFKKHPRNVLLRWRPGDDEVGFATTTRMEHTVTGETGRSEANCKARQIDGDANGLFADTKDLVEIDVNADERFDPFLETFPLRPVLTIHGQRWFVKADPFGKRLALEPALATGTVQLKTAARSQRDKIIDLIVTFAGEDGSVFSISGSGGATDLPVGRYAASVLYVAIKPAESGPTWEYTFSRNGSAGDKDWIEVNAGTRLDFDPIGELVMNAEFETPSPRKNGSCNLQPRLYTASGLLINLCRIEGQDPFAGPQCHVSLTDADGKLVGQTNSGFA